MARVLVIGDTHCPVMLESYPGFLKRIYRKHKCNKVVHIGDLIDHHGISYHQKAALHRDPEREFGLAIKQVKKLYRAFPQADWLTGNHDALTHRQAPVAVVS